MQGRARWLILFTLLLLVAGAVPVLADPPAGDQAPAGESGAGEVDPSPLPDGTDLAKAEEGLKEEEAERVRELEAPAAIAEREESILAYKGLESAAAVSDLLRSSFADELAILDQDPARVISDGTLRRNLGNDGGAVISDEGNPQLIDAEIPAEVPAEDGDLEKVNLSLDATAAGFEPENPITEITIPTSPAQAISLEDGEVSIAQAGADPDGSAHTFGDKDVIYPEILTDTDLLVSPLSNGVELFDQLRSPESPEVLRFDLQLPEGAELKANAGVAEVRKGERLIGFISPPHAVDAQGTYVPVTMDVQGRSLVLSVDHRGAEYAYPILVDPEYTQNDWVNISWVGGNRYDVLTDGTFLANSNNNKMLTSSFCIHACWGSGRGLHVSVQSGGWGNGWWAQWTYTPPGETSYLNGYLVNPFWRWDGENQACWSGPNPEPHEYDGLWSPTYGIYYQLYTLRALHGNVAAIFNNTAQTAKVMVIGMSTGGGSNDPCWRDLYAGGVATYMTDPENPTLDPISGQPSGWFDDSKQLGINVSAHDPGLGVSNVALDVEGSPQALLQKYPCSGTHDNPCPRDMSGTIPFNGDNFDEGVSSVYAVASDALSRPSAGQGFWAYVDSTPPEIALSGQLATATQETEGNGQDPKEWDHLSLPVYNLTVKAKDGSNASNKTRRSGVKNIEIYLDKKTEPESVSWKPNGSPCEDCEMTQTYQLKLDGLSSGKHTLRVVAVDQMNHKSERDIEFEYIPATGMKDEYVMQYFPLPDGKGNEAEEEHPSRPELAVNVMNGNLVFREKDVDVESYGADLEVERFYNSQLPISQNTEWGDGWTLAQTPELEPEAGSTPKEAQLLDTSGALEGEVQLPTEVGKTKFNPTLQATVSKEAGGYYALTDESGATEATLAFNGSGDTKELRTGRYSSIDYGYEAGKLDEIAVKDPASAGDLSEAEEVALEYVPPAPTYASAFGALGAGDGQLKLPGDIAIALNGDLFVVDRGNNRIERFSQEGKYLSKFGSEGTGNGQFKRPCSIAIDASGSLYVADAGNSRIEKFNEKGEFLKAVGSLGTGNTQFKEPEGIAVDPKGNVLVADTYNQRIQKLNSTLEFVSKFGSSGTGNGQFNQVNSIDVGPGGKVWVVDWGLNRVTQFNEAGEFAQQFGSAGAGDGQFSHPDAIEVDSRGDVFVADQSNNRIQQFNQAGKYQTKFGSKGSGNGQFSFTWPIGIAVDNRGGLWVTDVSNNRIEKWSLPNYRPSWYGAFGSMGSGDGQMKTPADTAIAPNGDVFVLDKGNSRVVRFSSEGKYLSKFGSVGTGSGQFKAPTSIAIDGSNNLWVADAGNYRIQEFTEGGEFVKAIGSQGTGDAQFSIAEGIATDLKGNVYVADTYNRRIQVFSEEGKFLFKFGSAGSGPGQFTEANAVDVGRHGDVYVADWGANRIERFNEKGEYVLQFGSPGTGDGQFTHADAVEADEKGNVWVGDQSNGRIELFNEVGDYITQFGSKGSGNGQFSFIYPMGVTADPGGGLWITDVSNNRIQKWQVPNTEPPRPPEENDPSVEVTLSSGLVSSVEGQEAGINTYAHTGELLTANDGPDGETKYEYDSEGRLKKVTLPNGTYGSITYNTTYGRVSKVTVDPAGSEPAKSTSFAYSDSPSRTTTVTPEGAIATTYNIGEDGSVFKWQNVSKPPTIENISGTLYSFYSRREEVKTGVQNLVVKASSPNGIYSIQIVANGTNLVDEATCTENEETIKVECEYPEPDEWVMETEDFAPGRLDLEVIVKSRVKGVDEASSERFWVNIPPPPPPPPDGLPVKPKFKEIKDFREEFGLDVWDPVENEMALNDRIFDLINAWTAGDPVARASRERWGVPLRTQDVAEMEYRESYIATDVPLIEEWAEVHRPSTFAGYYVDHRNGGILHVGFTQDQASSLAELKQEATLDATERISTYPTVPTMAQVSLKGTLQNVETAWSTDPVLAALINSAGIDEATNTVEVTGTSTEQIKASLKATLGQNAPIRVVYEEKGEEFDGRSHTTGRILAGDRVLAYETGANEANACTAGFGAWDQIGTKPNGESIVVPFLLTAGHCAQPGADFYRADSRDASEGWKRIGYVARTGLPKGGQNYETDGLAVRLNAGGLMPYYTYKNSEASKPDGPAGRAHHGELLCFSGQATNWPKKCGEVIGVRVRQTPNPGRQLFLITRFAGVPGDSGAPVWSPRSQTSIGLLSGGPHKAGLIKDWVTPLLVPRGFDSEKVPGILNAPGMGSLHLAVPGP